MHLSSDFAARLENIPWFENCGAEAPLECGFETTPVEQWSAADSAFDDAWEALRNRKNGDLTAGLSVHNRDAYREWNRLIVECKQAIQNRLIYATQDFWTAEKLNPYFGQTTARDVSLAWMEASYLEAKCRVEPFFLELFQVYEAGHFPCGWEGAFPHGKLLYY